MILGHGGLELRARANIAVAKCLLADPSYLGMYSFFSSYAFCPVHLHLIQVNFANPHYSNIEQIDSFSNFNSERVLVSLFTKISHAVSSYKTIF